MKILAAIRGFIYTLLALGLLVRLGLFIYDLFN
jgi:hypothetical protein